jgi:hypothetical protein
MRSLAFPRAWVVPVVWASLAVASVLARLVELAAATPDGTTDTPFFLETVGAPPAAMFVGFKPLTAPLLWTLVGGSPPAIVLFQVLLASASWACLAVLVARAVQTTWLKFCAFAGTAAIGLAWDVAHWDRYLISESISLSLLALVVACWLWLLEEWRPLKLGVLLLVLFLWANVRDTNAYALVMLAAVTLTVAFVRRKERRYALLAVALGCIALIGLTSSMVSNRWVFPYLDVVGKRILPDPEKTAYFERAGMPVTPALMSMSGKWASDDDGAFYRDPRLQSFRDWAASRGRPTYMSYLAGHPVQALAEPLADAPFILTFSPPDRPLALLLLVAAPCCLLFAALRRRGNQLRLPFQRAWLVPAVLLLLAYPHAAVIWHGDSMDVDRHLLPASIQLRVGLCLAIIFAVDAMLKSSIRYPGLSGQSKTAAVSQVETLLRGRGNRSAG